MRKFELFDYDDLLNLHKALMEAKFHDNPDNEYVAGSPIIAKIMNEIVDVLTDIDPHANKEDWKRWRKLGNHICYENGIYSKTLVKVSKDKLWKEYTKEQKIIAAKNYFSPFIATEEEIEDFINIVDSKNNI